METQALTPVSNGTNADGASADQRHAHNAATARSRYLIERNVPVPARSFPRRYLKYPFAEMMVGESFAVAGADARALARSASGFVRNCRPTWRFTARNVEHGARIWRVK